MRKIYILLFTLAAACCMYGCTRENAEQTTGNGDVIIRLEVDGLETKSAATSDENYVESLQVLVFKDINAAPAKHLTPVISAGAGPFEQSYATLTDFGGFSAAELKDAVVFAVANYATSLSSVTSLADAKSKVVNADGFLDDTAEGWKVKANPRFVMTAQGGFTMGTGSDAGKAVASLTLRRLASKVSIQITYASVDPENPIVTEDEANKTKTVWTPMTEGNVRVYLSNAVNNGKLEGNADTPVLFTYADNHPEGEGPLSSSAFYTYPTTWASDSDNAPFIKIIQPWSYKTIKYEGTSASPTNPVVIDQNVVELYYKVVFPGITSLAANTWYQPTVTLNVLGGESTRDMKEITATGFAILPWGTVGSGAGQPLSQINVEPAKYIAVERENTIVNNGGTVSINYVASGPTTLTVTSIYKDVFVNDTTARKYIYDPDRTHLVEGVDSLTKYKSAKVRDTYAASWFTNSYGTNPDPTRWNEGTITLNHELSPEIFKANGVDIWENFAARPYHYHLKLHLVSEGDDTSLDREFTIIQNPALLADGQKSTGWVCINGIDAIHGSINLTYQTNVASDLYNNVYQPRTSAYNPAPFVRLAGTVADDTYHAYISTKAKTDYNATQAAVNNLGTIHTYNYLAPNGANASRWRIIIRPTSKSGMYIMDPRINISTDTGHELYKLLHTHTTNFGNNTAASNFLDGTPLFANGSSASTYTDFKKYTPTGNSDEFRTVIAPEVMFASSYGKSTNMNYYVSLLRCAAYQEDGYPAGRWRLPTEEEIELAIDLHAAGAIPQLFSSGGRYWASSGRYIYYNAGAWTWKDDPTDQELTFPTNTQQASDPASIKVLGARCVYDTWYWGKDEVTALRTSDYQTDYSKPQYIWSGYSYTTK